MPPINYETLAAEQRNKEKNRKLKVRRQSWGSGSSPTPSLALVVIAGSAWVGNEVRALPQSQRSDRTLCGSTLTQEPCMLCPTGTQEEQEAQEEGGRGRAAD